MKITRISLSCIIAGCLCFGFIVGVYVYAPQFYRIKQANTTFDINLDGRRDLNIEFKNGHRTNLYGTDTMKRMDPSYTGDYFLPLSEMKLRDINTEIANLINEFQEKGIEIGYYPEVKVVALPFLQVLSKDKNAQNIFRKINKEGRKILLAKHYEINKYRIEIDVEHGLKQTTTWLSEIAD